MIISKELYPGFFGISFILAMLLLSCHGNFLELETDKPLIIDTLPSEQGEILEPEDKVQLFFSRDMEEDSLEKALRVLKDGEGYVKGSWFRSPRLWQFVPREPFQAGSSYYLISRGTLQAVSGVQEKSSLAIRFYQLTDPNTDPDTDPNTETAETAESEEAAEAGIESTLEELLSLSPEIAYFSLKKPLRTSQDLTFLDSEVGQSMGIPADTSIALRFNTSLEEELALEALSINPSHPGHWGRVERNLLFFVPTKDFEKGREYELGEGLFSFHLRTETVRLLSLEGQGSESFSLTQFQNEEAPQTIEPDPLDGAYQLKFTFSEPLEGNLAKAKLRERISLTPVFPGDAPFPSRVGISWVLDRQLIIRYKNLFPDPLGRKLLYRLTLAPETEGPTETSIEEEGRVLYLEVNP